MAVRFEDENGVDISDRVTGTVVVATQAQPPVDPPPPPPPTGTESPDGTGITAAGQPDIVDAQGSRWNLDFAKPWGDGHALVVTRDGAAQTTFGLELRYKDHMVHTRTAGYGWWRRRSADGVWESCPNP